MATLLIILFSYLFITLFGYSVHWALHKPWMGRFYQAHMTHHLKLYPLNDFTSDVYRSPGKDSTTRFFAVVSIPLVVLPIILYLFGVITLISVLIMLSIEFLMGFLHNYLHDAFHINNHFLSRTPFISDLFSIWFALHYQHHVDMNTNYGIFIFHWDRIFRTFKG